jgi:hypothetical protein
MSEGEKIDPDRQSLVQDPVNIALAELHNVNSNQKATRVRDLSQSASSADQTCKCCSMSAVEAI